MRDYKAFLRTKQQLAGDFGFEPEFIPKQAFDFQRDLIQWACRKGRGAIFADCGLGKTLMQLAWAENVAAETGRRVLILTPLAVSHQTATEAAKFGVHATRSHQGELDAQIVVTNYERLHYFKPEDFAGVVCDESSILKNFDGATRGAITEFMQGIPYRLLCTATAAPNDYVELGTSSEALGIMERRHMLSHFFTHDGKNTSSWRLKGHTRTRLFWQWMTSWARAIRKPSDLGYADDGFNLPPLHTRLHVVATDKPLDGFLFTLPAVGLDEQRAERRKTLYKRCEMAAALATCHNDPVICWCHLNEEGDLLEKLIPDAVQVSGSDSDERKEECFVGFKAGTIRALVTKPTIAGFGLNWEHCANQTFFPSHSFEQWYQSVRRSWRFGQKRPVTIDVVTSEGEQRVLGNLQRKSDQADAMFSEICAAMSREIFTRKQGRHNTQELIPSWL